jgi:hypothetical protein
VTALRFLIRNDARNFSQAASIRETLDAGSTEASALNTYDPYYGNELGLRIAIFRETGCGAKTAKFGQA